MPTFNVLLKTISQIKAQNLCKITSISLLFRRKMASEKRGNICSFKEIIFFTTEAFLEFLDVAID